MPRNPFTAYFTPERLKRFEELRERFPHWCLDWPKVAALRAPLIATRRLASAIQEMIEDLKSWEHPPELREDEQLEALADEVTGRAFRIAHSDERDHDLTEITLPAIHVALFKGIGLTLNASPERGLVIGHWFERLQHLVAHDDPANSETRVKLSKLAGKAWVTSAGAARSKDQMRHSKASGAREELGDYWLLIGEQIGLIPPTRQGGLADLIPDEWLSEFALEAEALRKKVRAYQPDSSTQDAVRALLLADSYPAGSGDRLRIARERVRQGKAYARWDDQVNLAEWCLRLAFPMLTADELRKTLVTPGWRWLVADRLLMTESVLSQHLHKYRNLS